MWTTLACTCQTVVKNHCGGFIAVLRVCRRKYKYLFHPWLSTDVHINAQETQRRCRNQLWIAGIFVSQPHWLNWCSARQEKHEVRRSVCRSLISSAENANLVQHWSYSHLLCIQKLTKMFEIPVGHLMHHVLKMKLNQNLKWQYQLCSWWWIFNLLPGIVTVSTINYDAKDVIVANDVLSKCVHSMRSLSFLPALPYLCLERSDSLTEQTQQLLADDFFIRTVFRVICALQACNFITCKLNWQSFDIKHKWLRKIRNWGGNRKQCTECFMLWRFISCQRLFCFALIRL